MGGESWSKIIRTLRYKVNIRSLYSLMLFVIIFILIRMNKTKRKQNKAFVGYMHQN